MIITEHIPSSEMFNLPFTVICLRCQAVSNRVFNEVIVTMERNVGTVDQGFNRFLAPEIVEDYYCTPLVNSHFNTMFVKCVIMTFASKSLGIHVSILCQVWRNECRSEIAPHHTSTGVFRCT